MNFSQAKVMAEKCIKKPFIFMTQKRKYMLSSLITNAEKYTLSEFKKTEGKSTCPVCGKGKPYIQRLLVRNNSGNCVGTAYVVHCNFCYYSPNAESKSTIEEAVSDWDAAVARIKKAQACAKDKELN
jgi:hypothetical protein